MSDPAIRRHSGCSDESPDAGAVIRTQTCFRLLVCRMVNLSLEHGNTDASCFAYVWLGMIAGPRFGNYQGGLSVRPAGYDLVERQGLRAVPGPHV